MGSGLVTPVHLIFLLLLALLLFGAKRLPEIGRSLGTGMREFKDSVTASGDKTETRSELPPPAATPAAPAVPQAPPAAAPETPPAAAEPERETEPVS
jgi:sec-independent protein translocase protein TatA